MNTSKILQVTFDIQPDDIVAFIDTNEAVDLASRPPLCMIQHGIAYPARIPRKRIHRESSRCRRAYAAVEPASGIADPRAGG